MHFPQPSYHSTMILLSLVDKRAKDQYHSRLSTLSGKRSYVTRAGALTLKTAENEIFLGTDTTWKQRYTDSKGRQHVQ